MGAPVGTLAAAGAATRSGDSNSEKSAIGAKPKALPNARLKRGTQNVETWFNLKSQETLF